MQEKEQLAFHGGPPIRETFLPYGKQWIDQSDINAVKKVLTSDFITTGPKIKELEQMISDYVQSKYTVLFSSGTASLHAACFAAGIQENDEVITSPLTFAGTSNSILYNMGIPVFVDVDPQSYNISPQSVESLINNRTKAILTVDFAGQPCDYDAIRSIADKYNLEIIEDAAHALGASYRGKPVGSFNDMTIFSFHPVKHITTGEGGAVTTNNKEYYDRLIQFRSHGITREPHKLIDYSGSWYYEMQFLGFNYRLTDLQAALGISQLKKVDNFIDRRKRIVELYNDSFKKMKEISLPSINPGSDSSWHLYVIRLNLEYLTVNRKTIFEAIKAENIGVNVHYIPVYYHPYYRRLGYQEGICPNAERLYEEIITLPLFPAMTDQDISDVINAVKKVISFYSE